MHAHKGWIHVFLVAFSCFITSTCCTNLLGLTHMSFHRLCLEYCHSHAYPLVNFLCFKPYNLSRFRDPFIHWLIYLFPYTYPLTHSTHSSQTFTRFVEVGRVVLINYGEFNGKLATVIDAVDSKRVLVDGPQDTTGVHRHVIALKRISLTDVVVKGTSFMIYFIHPVIHSLTHPLMKSFSHLLTHSLIHSLILRCKT